MTPTASALPGSSIELSLEGSDDSGTETATLKLDARNLAPGTYSVDVTLKSDGSTVALGTFTVDSEGEAEIEFGDEGDAPFPANFNPLDIATVTVSDATPVVLFTADLTNIATTGAMNLNATIKTTAGAGAPNATGNATLNVFVANGKMKGGVQFNAHGLPPNTTGNVAVNGVSAQTVKIDKNGNTSFRLKAKNKTGSIAPGVSLMQITSVSVSDQSANVLVTADF